MRTGVFSETRQPNNHYTSHGKTAGNRYVRKTMKYFNYTFKVASIFAKILGYFDVAKPKILDVMAWENFNGQFPSYKLLPQ